MSEKPTYEELKARVRELEKLESEWKRAESTLHLQSLVLDQIEDRVTVTDLDGVITYVNESETRSLAYSREELIGSSTTIYGDDPSKGATQRKILEETLQKGYWRGEVVNYSKDGQERIMDCRTQIIRDENGNAVALCGISTDITERKQTEESLRRSQERFLKVLDSIDATIYVADMDTYEILFMNQYMIESFGRDMTGEICWDVFRGETGPCGHCTNDQLVDDQGNTAGARVWDGRNPLTGKWYINYDRAIEWIDGRVVRLQIATDITRIKEMEEKLHHAQKMESIGNLAGGIAHDFNNILFPVVGLSEMMIEEFETGSPEYESMQAILDAGKRGRDLVRQILAVGRQSEKNPIPVRFQTVLKEVLQLVRSTVPANIEIVRDIQEDCGPVAADPSQLHQIAMNLITNANHALEGDVGEIKVSLAEVELKEQDCKDFEIAPGRYAVCRVSDTGHGIEVSDRDRIFDPYFTTKGHGKGTGLGLSVVHGIVSGYGGHIEVESETGRGTAFYVYLPLAERSGETSESLEDGPMPAGDEAVLLVDDEAPIVKMESLLLQKLGYHVESRTGSLEALEKFKSAPDRFDLVITDMSMPNMTGEKLAQEIISIRPDIPIILCTGFSERIDRERARALGIKEFLMKPALNRDIAQTVRNVLDQAKQGG